LNACDGATLQVSKVAKGDAGLELKNGVLFYNNTPFDGILLEFDQINGTNNESNYVGGKKEGIERKVYTNNMLAEERMYDKGLKIGIHKGWYKDGSVKFEYHYGNGMYDGSFKEWYQNGIPLKDFNYKKGKEYGSQKMWLSNGKIRANYVVKNGERFGLIGLKKCYSVTKK
jgi:antitoxin component YwqK of YwqJK toxin-antitoxin module